MLLKIFELFVGFIYLKFIYAEHKNNLGEV